MMIVKRVPLEEEPISGKDRIDRYDQYSSHFMMPEYRYFVRKILSRGIKSGRVLDMGTGNGLLSIQLAKAQDTNFKITGLDISSDMLKKANENVTKNGLEGKIVLVQGTGAALPFSDHCFDMVISYASLHHWQEPVSVFNEIQRVTKNQGLIIVRDNRRVIGNPFWEACIWSISRFMSIEQRVLWPKAILASYTIPEIRNMLISSRIKNYRVYADYVKLDICIESTPS